MANLRVKKTKYALLEEAIGKQDEQLAEQAAEIQRLLALINKLDAYNQVLIAAADVRLERKQRRAS